MGILFFSFLFICSYSICYTQSAPDILWTKTFGGDNMERAYSVQQTADSGFVIAGCTSSYGSGGFDAWLVKQMSLVTKNGIKHMAIPWEIMQKMDGKHQTEDLS